MTRADVSSDVRIPMVSRKHRSLVVTHRTRRSGIVCIPSGILAIYDATLRKRRVFRVEKAPTYLRAAR